MSNRNAYNKMDQVADNMERQTLHNSLNTSIQTDASTLVTTINIDNDMIPTTSQQNLQRQQYLQIRIDVDSTRINMESNSINNQTTNIDEIQRVPNLFTMLRHQLSRSQLHSPSNRENVNVHSRTWRENLYQVLSSPVSSRARAIFTPSSASSGEQFNLSFNNQNINSTVDDLQTSSRNPQSNVLETQNSHLTEESSLQENSSSDSQTSAVDISANNINSSSGSFFNSSTNGGRQAERQSTVVNNATVANEDMADDVNAVGALIVARIVTHFICYMPFIFIIIIKLTHDHIFGILDILTLQTVVCLVNNSLPNQVAKLNQKSLNVLLRILILVVFFLTYRFMLPDFSPDPFGLLINPRETTITVINSDHKIKEVLASAKTNNLNNSISLGNLLYYVAVNDLILKLLTQFIKIIVTIFPTKMIRHKTRCRLYALIEGISQLYRALVPIKLWLIYLSGSYTGLRVLFGILLCSLYMAAKLYELFERCKKLKNAITNVIRNMDYNRKPTRDEWEAAGSVCPICHDSYLSPVILQCGHIFCDECVNTWFSREQTCPMCRAKVSEDPTWQDGATTLFLQLF